ncbi:MAG TPA: Snf7 family protein [Nitrososphaerales archaeon]|nr:Snf7 family protein [Nitrososphaerales archaeon]
MTEFTDRWETNRDKETVPKMIKDAMNPAGDLRRRLVDTDRSLTAQIGKLDKTLTKMTEKEKVLFNKTTVAFQKHDTTMAQAYANELSEHRKAMKLVQSSRLCLEQVQMRLKTITDFGDLANVIAPVGQVVRTVRNSLQNVMPSANDTLSEISNGLQGMMLEVGSVPGLSMNFESSSEEAEKILAEASVVAETKMASTLPDVPDTSVTSDSNSSI